MVVWKRKMAEKARQAYGIDKGFVPTSNARILATFAETKKFAEALKKFDKHTTMHVMSTKEFALQTTQFLSVSVPRMHSEKTPGQPTPDDESSLIGARVDLEKITQSAQGGQERIHAYVQDPLRKWLANFDTVVLAKNSVEQLRLLLDSRRRSLATLEGKLTLMRSKVGDDDPKLIKLAEKKHRQYGKMTQVREDFQRKEAVTYTNMLHLVNDVRYVQQHLHKLFEVQREVYTDICDAFPAVSGPLTHSAHTASDAGAEEADYPYSQPVDGEYGNMSSRAHSDAGRGVAASTESHLQDYGNRVDGFSGDISRKTGGSDRYQGLHDSHRFNPV